MEPQITDRDYRLLFERINQGFCLLERIAGSAVADDTLPDYRFLLINPALEQHTGVAGIQGQNIRAALPDAALMMIPLFEQVIRAGEPKKHELYLPESARWLEAEIFPAERTGCIAVLCTNVTERKKTEQQLRSFNMRLEREVYERTAELQKSRLLLKATLDSTADMIQVFKAVRDNSNRIVDFQWLLMNHAAELAFGDVAGRTLLENNPGVVMEGIFKRFVQVVETGVTQRYEQHYVHEQFDGWFYQSVVKLNDGVATSTADITDHKLAELLLEKQRQEYYSLVENTPDVITRWDAGLRLLYANPAFAEKTGKNLDELLGRTRLEMDQPAHFAISFMNSLAKVFVQKKASEHYYSFQTPGGEVFYHSRLVPEIENGDVKSVLSIARDITELRRTELDLSESRGLLQAAFDASVHAFSVLKCIRDINGRIVDFEWIYANREVKRRARQKDLVGRRMTNIYTGTASKRWIDRYATVAETGKILDIEEYFDENNRWFHVVGQKVGEILIVTSEDTTFRKKAEHELLESHERLQSVFDTTLVQIAILEAVRNEKGAIADLQIKMANKEQEKESGQAKLVGQSYRYAYPAIEETGVFDRIVHTIETGESQQVEYYLQVGGVLKWYTSMFTRMNDGVVATTIDMTARKHAENEQLRNYLLLQQSESIASLGSWEYDVTGDEFIWSDGMYRLFDLQKGTPVNPGIYLHYATPESRMAAKRVLSYLKNFDVDFEETIIIRVSDQNKVLHLKAAITRDSNGKAIRVLGVNMDITEIQVAVERIKNMQADQQIEIFRVSLSTLEEERRRISESLHNGLGQLLYGVKISLGGLKQETGQKEFINIKNYTDKLLNDAIADARRISHDLMPATLEEFGLREAIMDICHQFHDSVKFSCRISGLNGRLEKYIELAVYRTVQELMINVVKHADATEAVTMLDFKRQSVTIRVSDNGRGIKNTTRQQSGIGLVSIRSKIRLLNGKVDIHSDEGKGTTIEITIPLPANLLPDAG